MAVNRVLHRDDRVVIDRVQRGSGQRTRQGLQAV